MPPTIGAAIRLITSEPVPVPYNIGNKPIITVPPVIIIGLILKPAPCSTACNISALVVAFPWAALSASKAW